MSTDYRTLNKEVAADDLFDGRLEEFGIREAIAKDTTPSSRLLTDGRYYVWVYISDDGVVGSFTRYGGNVVHKILAAICTAFDVEIVSEYQPQFWGFATQAEWHACEDEMSRESDERFYEDLMRYLRGTASCRAPMERSGPRPCGFWLRKIHRCCCRRARASS
jgi:hypothetical protein